MGLYGANKRSTWTEALDLAFELAKGKLLRLSPEEVQEKAWVVWREEGRFWEVPFFGRPFRVFYPSGEVYGPNGHRVDRLREVLLLHYLIQAKGTGIGGKWVDFRKLPGGLFYFPVFKQRVIVPFVKAFGERTEVFLSAAEKLGGTVLPFADVCVSFKAFPQVLVAFGLWERKGEIGPEGFVLFDQRAPEHLPTEDLIWVCHEALGFLRT